MRSPLSLLSSLTTAPWLFTITLCLMLSANANPTDISLSWQPLNEPGSGGRIDSISVSPYNSNHLLVGGDVLGTRRSIDGGDRWTATSGWLNYEISDFTWHPQDPNIVWAGSLSGPHVSTDGGATWEVKRSGFPAINSGKYTAPIEKVLFDPNSDHLLGFGGDRRQLRPPSELDGYGTVWLSKDEGESWSLLSKIVQDGNIVSASYAGNSDSEIYTAVSQKGVFYSGDDGASWTSRSQGLPADEAGNIPISSLSAHPNDARTVWATVKDFGIYKTTDGGNYWQLLSEGIPSGGSEFGAVEIDATGRTLYAGNSNFRDRPGVYKSTDGGQSWRHQFYNNNQIKDRQRPYPGGIRPWWIEIDPTTSDVVYIGTDNGIYQSLNGGEDWTVLGTRKTEKGWQGSGFSGLVARSVEWNPYDSDHVVLQGMDAAKAVQSWDGGDHWRVENSGLPYYSGGHDVTFAPGAIFAAFGQSDPSNDLIARSEDNGQQWAILQPPTTGIEATQIHVDSSDPNRLWVVIDRQLWYSSNALQTTEPLWTQLDVGASGQRGGRNSSSPQHRTVLYRNR